SAFARAARIDPLAAATYEAAWVPAPSIEPAAPRNATCVLLADPGPLASSLAAALEQHGARCVLVAPGSAFARDGEHAYRADPTSASDAERLAREILRGARACVVHLWGADTGSEGREPTSMPRDLTIRWRSAFTFAQATVLAGLRDPPRLWLVSRGLNADGE